MQARLVFLATLLVLITIHFETSEQGPVKLLKRGSPVFKIRKKSAVPHPSNSHATHHQDQTSDTENLDKPINNEIEDGSPIQQEEETSPAYGINSLSWWRKYIRVFKLVKGASIGVDLIEHFQAYLN